MFIPTVSYFRITLSEHDAPKKAKRNHGHKKGQRNSKGKLTQSKITVGKQ